MPVFLPAFLPTFDANDRRSYSEGVNVLRYPVILEPDTNGTVLVSFPDFPEAHTFGDDESEALARAADLLEDVLADYAGTGRKIPPPPDARLPA
jgi:predicted RNase H-like HicB family nuclease